MRQPYVYTITQTGIWILVHKNGELIFRTDNLEFALHVIRKTQENS